MALFRTKLTGKSRGTIQENNWFEPRQSWVRLANVAANATFVLPKSCRLTGKAIIVNRSGNTQAAITIGTTAAGTQIDAGATTATLVTAVRQGTATAIDNVTDRTIYVESAAWQAGVTVLLEAEEYPVIPDTSALS